MVEKETNRESEEISRPGVFNEWVSKLRDGGENEILLGSLSEVEEFKILPGSENFCGVGWPRRSRSESNWK